MRIGILLAICLILGPAHAQDTDNQEFSALAQQLRDLATDLDREDGAIRADIERLRTTFDRLSREFSNFDREYEELENFLAQSASLEARITKLESSLGTIQMSATNAEAISKSMRWIVAIVSFLITAMTVVFGLLFSQRFLNLQTDARVAHEVLARIEKSMDDERKVEREDRAEMRETVSQVKKWLQEQES